MRHKTIRTLLLTIATFVGLIGLAGCAQSPAYEQMVRAMDSTLNQSIGPEYEAYVNNDPSLTADDRSLRLSTLTMAREAVARAGDELGVTPLTPRGVP